MTEEQREFLKEFENSIRKIPTAQKYWRPQLQRSQFTAILEAIHAYNSAGTVKSETSA